MPQPRSVVLVVDVANVMGSRPDGWWRDRAGAAGRLLTRLTSIADRELADPGATPGARIRVSGILAVLEGPARTVPDVAGVSVVRAAGDGDDALVAQVATLMRAGQAVLAVSADRALRARLPGGVIVAGPHWLLSALDGSG